MIEIIDYTVKNQQDNLLLQLSLTIEAGQCLVICGPSGGGKSTLLKVINGLIHQEQQLTTTGQLCYQQQNIDNIPVELRASYIGSLFQNPKRQFFYGQVLNELAFGCENINMPREKILSVINQTVEQFNISSLLNKNLFHCSGGEKQKVACAAITTLSPTIYLLDEPSANLDKQAVKQLQQILLMLKAQGKTLIVAEHYLSYLLPVLDKVIYLNEGQIQHQWTNEQFNQLSSNDLQQLGLRQLNHHCHINSYHNEGELQLQQLTYQYHKASAPIIDIANLSFEKGKLTAIIGQNGVGKTTLAKLLTGEVKATSGSIILDGKPLSPRQLMNTSYIVMQDVNCQLFCESVEQEITLGQPLSEEAMQLIHEFDLQDKLKQHPMTLSGGQKQRLAVICACLMARDIIIFDEPTSGLDYKNMQSFIKLCRQLTAKNKIVLIITHDEQLLTHCDQVVNLREYNAS